MTSHRPPARPPARASARSAARSPARSPARSARLALTTLALLALGGCTTLRPDAGFGALEEAAQSRLGKQITWARNDADQDRIDARVAQLLARPLQAEDAVQIALLNNRGLQAAFSELGISEADRVQAGRLPNPGLRLGRLRQGDDLEIDRSLQFNLARLLWLPQVNALEMRRFEQARGAVLGTLLALAADTRSAYYGALAADETVRYMGQVQSAAEAGAELARRQALAGNWNRLQQAREQSFYADAALGAVRAEQARGAARERLTRLLGLWGAQTDFRLPERLPDLPPAAKELPDIEQTAMAQRLDVQAARQGAEQVARQLGLTRRTRFVNVLELGVVQNSYSNAPAQRGYEISVELPLFDWGEARVAKAEAVYMQALHRAAETAVNARSEVRLAYAAYRSSYDIAKHFRDEIVPLKKRISEENLLRYNGMLIGVFELLADARSQIAGVNAAIDALRDFWIAQADLDMALVGKPNLAGASALTATSAESGGAGH